MQQQTMDTRRPDKPTAWTKSNPSRPAAHPPLRVGGSPNHLACIYA